MGLWGSQQMDTFSRACGGVGSPIKATIEQLRKAPAAVQKVRPANRQQMCCCCGNRACDIKMKICSAIAYGPKVRLKYVKNKNLSSNKKDHYFIICANKV